MGTYWIKCPWLGVFSTEPDSNRIFSSSPYKVHTCGTGLCEEALREGTVSIAGPLLPPGIYVAVLARDNFDNGRYHILGESEEFTVVHDACDDAEYR